MSDAKTKARNRRFYLRHRTRILAKQKAYARFWSTGFTPETFALALRIQHGKCGICLCDLSKLPSLRVNADHCHATNTPRGVLCNGCNVALGIFDDDVALLQRAIGYLNNPPLKGTLDALR